MGGIRDRLAQGGVQGYPAVVDVDLGPGVIAKSPKEPVPDQSNGNARGQLERPRPKAGVAVSWSKRNGLSLTLPSHAPYDVRVAVGWGGVRFRAAD